MEKRLNKKRLLLATLGIAIILSVPIFGYFMEQVEMNTSMEVLFNYTVALFAGECLAGAFLLGAMFLMGGTLPQWFWVTE